jgi:hypothetical protein
MTSTKWANGNKVVDIVTNEVGVIVDPPPSQGEPSDACVFIVWEDGTCGWINKDEVKRV